MRAIILAAGMGNRLEEHTTDTPKAMVTVDDRPFLSYAIEYANYIGASDIRVVGGYQYQQVADFLKAEHPEIQSVENKEYTLQNLVSFKTVLDTVDDSEDLLMINIDYIFHRETLDLMKNESHGTAVFCSFDLSGDADDVMKVQVDADGNMIDMTKTLTEFQAIYTGYWYVEKENIPLMREIVEHLLGTVDLKTTPVEAVFKEFTNRGAPMRVADIGSPTWLEVDTPEELAEARAKIGEYEHDR